MGAFGQIVAEWLAARARSKVHRGASARFCRCPAAGTWPRGKWRKSAMARRPDQADKAQTGKACLHGRGRQTAATRWRPRRIGSAAAMQQHRHDTRRGGRDAAGIADSTFAAPNAESNLALALAARHTPRRRGGGRGWTGAAVGGSRRALVAPRSRQHRGGTLLGGATVALAAASPFVGALNCPARGGAAWRGRRTTTRRACSFPAWKLNLKGPAPSSMPPASGQRAAAAARVPRESGCSTSAARCAMHRVHGTADGSRQLGAGTCREGGEGVQDSRLCPHVTRSSEELLVVLQKPRSGAAPPHAPPHAPPRHAPRCLSLSGRPRRAAPRRGSAQPYGRCTCAALEISCA